MQLPATATLDKAAELADTLPAAVASGTGVLRIDASALQALRQFHHRAAAASPPPGPGGRPRF
jgi:hypothetical protein